MVTLRKTFTQTKKNDKRLTRMKSIVRPSIALFIFAIFWELIPRIGIVDRVFFPPFSEVITTWWRLILNGELWKHFSTSITRSAFGFFIAIGIAVPLGLLIGWYPLIRDVFNPVLELFRNTAALALLPVFILILGIGELSKVSIIVFACVWPILLNTIAAVRDVDPLYIKSAKSMNLTDLQLFKKVILPASIPTIFTGIRMAGTGAVLVLIAAEMVGAKAGLGYYITFTQYNFQIPEMYAGILTISLLGLTINQLLLFTEKYFSKWKITT